MKEEICNHEFKQKEYRGLKVVAKWKVCIKCDKDTDREVLNIGVEA